MKLFVFGMNYDPVQETDENYLTTFKIPANTHEEASAKLKALIGPALAKKCWLNDERDY